MVHIHRIPWIDIVKGYAIILMVFGHSSLPSSIQSWIFAFHMPVFFILSGMTTKWDNCSFLRFIANKSISLGRPFVIYSVICIVIITGFNLAQLSLSSGWGDFALWFVPVLLISLILCKGLIYIGSDLYVTGILLILAYLSGKLTTLGYSLPWSLSVVPYASFFIIFGKIIKLKITAHKIDKLWVLITSFFFTFLLSHFYKLDMSHNQILPLLPITLGALSGSLFLFVTSMVTDKSSKVFSKIIQSVGKETFIILSFSQIFIMMMNKYFECNFILKYCSLIIALIILKHIKDLFKNLYYHKNC